MATRYLGPSNYVEDWGIEPQTLGLQRTWVYSYADLAHTTQPRFTVEESLDRRSANHANEVGLVGQWLANLARSS